MPEHSLSRTRIEKFAHKLNDRIIIHATWLRENIMISVKRLSLDCKKREEPDRNPRHVLGPSHDLLLHFPHHTVHRRCKILQELVLSEYLTTICTSCVMDVWEPGTDHRACWLKLECYFTQMKYRASGRTLWLFRYSEYTGQAWDRHLTRDCTD